MTPDDSATVAEPSPCTRARITNGSALHGARKVDGRSASARRWRDIYREVCTAIGSDATPAQLQLARRCATLVVAGEAIDAQAEAGEPIDVGESVKVSGAVTRVLDALGLLDRNADDTDPLATWREAIGGGDA